MGKIILITGGARSGTSSFAEEYAAKYGKKIAYIATSHIYDDEMAYRVKLHQNRRPSDWTTYEAPFKAHEAIKKAFNNHNMILFDCLTLYLSNYLCKDDIDSCNMDKLNIEVHEIMQNLIDAVKNENEEHKTCIFVTNEVGSGIVPENALARKYRDLAGLSNQQFAKFADEVYFVVSGIPLKIK